MDTSFGVKNNMFFIWHHSLLFHLAPLPPFSFGTTPSFFIWHHSLLFHLAPLPPFSFGTTPSFFIWNHSLLFLNFFGLCVPVHFLLHLSLFLSGEEVFFILFFTSVVLCVHVYVHTHV